MLNKWPKDQDLLNTKAVEKTYEAAHVEAKSKMNIGSRLEVLRNKMLYLWIQFY